MEKEKNITDNIFNIEINDNCVWLTDKRDGNKIHMTIDQLTNFVMQVWDIVIGGVIKR